MKTESNINARRAIGLALALTMMGACATTTADPRAAELAPPLGAGETGGAASVAPGSTGTAEPTPGGSTVGPSGTPSDSTVVPTETSVGGPSTGSTSSPTAPTPTPTSTTTGGPVPVGRGITDDTIRIGIVRPSDAANDTFGAFGCTVCSTGDEKSASEYPATWLNERGGLAGRQVEIVVEEFDFSGSADADSEYQRICTALTQDTQVFAVMMFNSSSIVSENFVACLAQADTPLILQTADPIDRSLFEAYPSHLFMPGNVEGNRLFVKYVDGLLGQGYFDDGATVGAVYMDTGPNRRLVEQVLKPQLAKHGITLAAEFAATDIGQAPSSVLEMRGNNVDHVLLWGAAITFVFVAAAQNQRYYPVYGFNSYAVPSLVQQQFPEAFVNGANVVGTLPWWDVTQAHEPPLNSTATQCLDMAKAGGYDAQAERTAESRIYFWCDLWLFLREGIERAKNTALTPLGFRGAVDGLGSALTMSTNFSTHLAAGWHAGASSYRDVRWDQGCLCFQYVGGDRPID